MSTAMSSSRWRISFDGASPGHGTVSHSLLARKVGLRWTSAAVTWPVSAALTNERGYLPSISGDRRTATDRSRNDVGMASALAAIAVRRVDVSARSLWSFA
jgi:hypothetical protein